MKNNKEEKKKAKDEKFSQYNKYFRKRKRMEYLRAIKSVNWQFECDKFDLKDYLNKRNNLDMGCLGNYYYYY